MIPLSPGETTAVAKYEKNKEKKKDPFRHE